MGMHREATKHMPDRSDKSLISVLLGEEEESLLLFLLEMIRDLFNFRVLS